MSQPIGKNLVPSPVHPDQARKNMEQALPPFTEHLLAREKAAFQEQEAKAEKELAKNRAKFEHATKGIDWVLQERVAFIGAKNARLKYLALVNEGFNEQQALLLCYQTL